MIVEANVAPPVPVPAAPPTKNEEGLDVPLLGSVTVTWLAPPVTMSAAGIVAVNWLAETKVVVNELPLNCTAEEAVKFFPLTVRATSGPPFVAEPGLKEAMVGVVRPGMIGGGGVGKGVAAGTAVDIGLTKLPPIMKRWPSLVLKAKPFCPQRTSRCALPPTPEMVMDP